MQIFVSGTWPWLKSSPDCIYSYSNGRLWHEFTLSHWRILITAWLPHCCDCNQCSHVCWGRHSEGLLLAYMPLLLPEKTLQLFPILCATSYLVRMTLLGEGTTPLDEEKLFFSRDDGRCSHNRLGGVRVFRPRGVFGMWSADFVLVPVLGSGQGCLHGDRS